MSKLVIEVRPMNRMLQRLARQLSNLYALAIGMHYTVT